MAALRRSTRDEEEPTLAALSTLRPLGQIRNSFILAVNEDGLWIVDQHVAHERVLFERVLKQRAAQKVESQRLLMPIVLELSPAQQAVFAEIADELQHNGFEAEPFGARSVAVKVAPAGVDAAAVEKMLHELLDQISREEQSLNLEKIRGRDCGVDRVPRGDQSQHAAGAKQDGVAAGGAGEDGSSYVVPAWQAGGAAVFCKGYSEGVQENLSS